jgi:uncharacterized protein
MGLPVSQRFKPLDFYNQSLISRYQLLPFRFIRLDAKRYVLTNEVGEYVVLPQNLLQDFVGVQPGYVQNGTRCKVM